MSLFSVLAVFASGCVDAPTPLWPNHAGSIGTPSRGVLTGGAPLPDQTASLVRLRKNERKYGLPRFIAAIERAADAVQAERPGARLVVGDLSAPHGGVLLPQHVSHRSGRDADLVLYMRTLEGASVESPGFISVGRDGLAWDKEQKRYLRFDVEREWLLVRALVDDDTARVQWLFVNDNVRAMLIEWAVARREEPYIVQRAMDVMLQSGGPHDDHIHVRTACTDEEVATGCEFTGPRRVWLEPEGQPQKQPTTQDELAAILEPIE